MLVIRSYMTARNGLTSMDRVQTEFLGLTSTEISNHLVLLGENSYHGGQIYRALYGRRQFTFEVMTELSKALRRKLSQTALISLPRVHSTQLSIDGTQKYLLELKDGQKIESVFIPEDQRHTLCISTQAGCPMECQFCLTALMGFARNLTVGEIVGQVLFILKDRKEKDNEFSPHASSKSTNIVLMGMGEPLLNLENVAKALVLLTDRAGVGISPHRITLSTVGLAPKILQLAKATVVPNLAISLSATTDEVRDQLMPINKRYPINTLLETCAQFPLGPRQRITFEYVLIDGVNDSESDARRLVKLLSRIRSKVNLLPLNQGKDNRMRPSSPQRVKHFQQLLVSKGLPAYVRRARGADIFAACGQLHHVQSKLQNVH